MKLVTTSIHGNIFTSEILERIRSEDIRYQTPKDFNLKPNEYVRDEISNAWIILNSHWKIFKQKREALKTSETGVTETRGNWAKYFFELLGYDISLTNAKSINDKSYAISHEVNNKDGFPIHVVGCNQSLDKRHENGVRARLSPHALMQEYINSTEYLYGYITNGLYLRVLRDATQLSKLSYLEFNLEQMMEEGHYNEFALLYRLLHATRIADNKDDSANSYLEFYHNEAIASGTRIRDRLSDAFYTSILSLSNGFLKHNSNVYLRTQISEGNITAKSFYAQILKVAYRLLFLSVIEERGLIYPSELSEEEQRLSEIYHKYYSIGRLVKIANNRHFVDLKKDDLWQSMMMTFKLFEDDYTGSKLGIEPLGFGLFATSAISHLRDLRLSNQIMIEVISLFNYFENDKKQRVLVNYADLNVEEIGSVYEGLLSLEPMFSNIDNSHISFTFKDGTSRKESASYYTHHDLVRELMQSTLIPLIDKRVEEAGPNKEEQQKAILDIKVCDPSVGSGHMLLEAARMLAYHYVKVSTDTEPTPREYRKALRLVIQNCIYGVDLNEEAVELCKLALWLEGHNSGAPLSFLDHKIKHGNSLVGVHNPLLIDDGIPSDAYATNNKDHKAAATALKKKNSDFVKTKQQSFNFIESNSRYYNTLKDDVAKLSSINQNDIQGVRDAEKLYNKMKGNPEWYNEWTICNLWCAPFFADYSEDNVLKVPTTEHLMLFKNSPSTLDGRIRGYVDGMASDNNFFHWHLEFPDIYAKGGFDVMIGNPPWERIKLQEKEFFLNKYDDIVNASNAAARKKKIANLEHTNIGLFAEYNEAVKFSDDFSHFIRKSGIFPLTAVGDINLYAIFNELFYNKINKNGRSGIVCPTGIATDNNTKDFFAEIVVNNRLISFYDFENRSKLFPIDSRFKFCLLTLGDKPANEKIKFAFFLHQVEDIDDKNRVFELSTQDFININPNTKTSPVFRTQKDAELTSKIYSRLPIILNEELNQNIWSLKFYSQFHMSNDSHLFEETRPNSDYIPLYESKFIWHYNHRNSTFEDSSVRTATNDVSIEQSDDPTYKIKPWYWIKREEVEARTDEKYFIGFRNISNVTNERTSIFSLVPFSGVGHSMPLVSINDVDNKFLFLGLVSSLFFDFLVRQKLGGTNLTYAYVYQFPTLSPKTFTEDDKNYILPRVAELSYTAWDIKNAFDDLWSVADTSLKQKIEEQHIENATACSGANSWDKPEWADEHPWIEWNKEDGIPLPPFRWNEERRLKLKAELDAYYALLFGLERDEVRYILDPKAVMGEDFPGETFRVLKDKDIRDHGEYITQRLVLEAYDKLRPQWDMPSHLKKLDELWHYHQIDLSEKKKGKPTRTKAKATVPKKKDDDGMKGLWD